MNGTIAYDSEDELKDTTVEEFDPADTAKSYRTGNFYHVFSENMLTVTAPIAANFRTYGYVVMHTPIAHINSLSDGMLLPIYSTFVIIFCAVSADPADLPLSCYQTAEADHSGGKGIRCREPEV